MEAKGLLLQVTDLSSRLNWSKTPVCLTPTCVPLPPVVLPAIESISPSLSVRVLEAVHSIGVNDVSSTWDRRGGSHDLRGSFSTGAQLVGSPWGTCQFQEPPLRKPQQGLHKALSSFPDQMQALQPGLGFTISDVAL